MQIFVAWWGLVMALEVEPADGIGEVLDKVRARLLTQDDGSTIDEDGRPMFRLIYNGTQLLECKTVADYDLKQGDKLILGTLLFGH